jgi:hypothetical protein
MLDDIIDDNVVKFPEGNEYGFGTAAPSISGALCDLSNKKGDWLVITPGTATVHLGSEQLAVKCTKDGYQPATQMENSSPNMAAIMLNGAVETTISGSAWTYPKKITAPLQAVLVPGSPTS